MPDSMSAALVLKETFGFERFRPGQEDVVNRLLAGNNLLAIMPTGAGKSVCYQVPAIVRKGRTIVVSPLVALMDDQVAALEANGVPVASIHSGRSREQNIADWRKFVNGDAKILYMSPERLMSDRMLAALGPLQPTMFVVDEAHCISKWGTGFRPDYAALDQLKDQFPEAAIAGFTATADKTTQRDIADKLFSGEGDIIVQGFDRPNIWLGVAPKSRWRDQLLDFLNERKDQSGIVYCVSRRLTEEVAEFINEAGFRAFPYHAGMSPEARSESQEIFMADEAVIMVATIAFGMGIDKSDIRFVFHLNLPGSMEAYYQEIGRAGRDGAPADVFMIYGLDDVRTRRQFIEQDGSDADHVRREHKRLDSLLAYCEATQCRRVLLLSYFGDDSEPCGNCDICQNPPILIDGTTEAQMLFSAVIRTGERFGTMHLIDILRGIANEKISSLAHDKLPTFGVGAEHSKQFWQAFIRQAVAGGYLIIDIDRFGGLRLSKLGRSVLKGEEQFLYREIKPSKPPSGSSSRSRTTLQDMSGLDIELFQRLKALRKELAHERGVPAFVIFSDRTLQEISAVKPTTLEELASVNGVGPKKLQDLGELFLETVNE